MKSFGRAFVVVLIAASISSKSQDEMQRRRLHGTDTVLQMTSKQRHVNVTSLLFKDGLLFACGLDDAMVSADSGRTWLPVGEELRQHTVVDITTSGDSIITLAPSGTLNVTTNNGLSWARLSSGTGKQTNVIVRDPTGWHGGYDAERDKTWSTSEERILIRDSMIIVERPSGCRLLHTSPEFSGASCITASYRHVFIGRGRHGIVTFDRTAGTAMLNDYDLHSREYISSLCVDAGMLYASLSTGTTGLYRRSEYGQHWYTMPIDQPVTQMDVLCIRATGKGVLVGMREGGVGFFDHARVTGTIIHMGYRDANINALQPARGGVLINTQLRGPSLVRTPDRSIRDLSVTLPPCFAPSSCTFGATIVTACQDGSVFITSDTGRTWIRVSKPLTAGEMVRVHAEDSTLLLLSAKGVLSSVDTGRTWTPIHPGLAQFELWTMLRQDSADVFLANAGAFRAVSGKTVEKLNLPTDFEQQPFISQLARHGSSIYTSGFPALMKSNDAGRTWKVHYSPEAMATRCLTIGGDYLYTASSDGFIYRVRLVDLERALRDPGR